MRWRVSDKYEWKIWFAWHPIEVGDEIVWCERVLRKLDHLTYGGSPIYYYKRIEDAGTLVERQP